MTGFTFAADLAAFAEAIDVDLDTVHDRVIHDIHNRVTMRTPVDTGRARASWQITTGAPSTFVPAPATYDSTAGGAAYQPPPPITPPMSIKDTVYITNNIPYIEYLENGTSDQSPTGMVAITLAEIEAEIALTTAAL